MESNNIIDKRIEYTIGTHNGNVVIFEDENIIVNIPMQQGEYGKYKVTEIANKICKAVNNYYSLLEALKDCWKDSINTDNNCQMRPETTMKILAAIQKAEQ